jgi:Xaa-Pro dipeptidase
LGLEAWREALVPGATEAETAAAAEATIHSLIGKHEIISARAWATVQSGHHTAQAGCFNRSSGRRLAAGDLALIELATCVNGYWSDLTRTLPVGQAVDEADEVLKAVSEAQLAAIQSIRSCVPASDVDAAARESLHQAGFASYFTLATGHHTGFRYHDPGFAISPGTRDTLDCGMVFTVEPGAYIPERGVGARIEDIVVVTNS